MASSRVYVRGLPPSISESDFREHFSKRCPITDIQLKPQRRIGYVGFKTAEDAAKAVKYFHKSFIRMSRLHVELAKTAGDAPKSRHSVNRKKLAVSSEANINRVDNPLKRKRTENEAQAEPHNGAGEEQLVRPLPSPATVTEDRPSGVPADAVPSDRRPEKDAEDELEQLEDHIGESAVNHAADDDDWMRSRTTRLLGLQDYDDNLSRDREKEAEGQVRDDGVPRTEDKNVEEPDEDNDGQAVMDASDPAVEEDNSSAIAKARTTSKRLFLRNLAYTVNEEDVRTALEPFGVLTEVKVPLDFKSGSSKGFAFAEFEEIEQAAEAMDRLDGSILQGRLVHVIPAISKREPKLDEFSTSQLPLKKRKLIEKRAESASSTFNWNSLYMNADAVITSAASRLGVSKSELLDPTSSDTAVKQAQIETHSIQEARRYFETHGVDLDSFGRSNREGNALLVKNFKYDTKAEDLKKLFSQSGDVTRVLMPPGGTIAIVEFPNKVQAKTAFSAFAYRKYKDSILFLERAPKDLFNKSADSKPRSADHATLAGQPASAGGASQEADPDPEADDGVETTTLFVRNLNFVTTNEGLREAFEPMEGLLSARVKTKPDPKREGGLLSMGFGFLEFRTNDQAKAAFLAMNGRELDGHELQIKASHKGQDAAAERRREDRAKRQKQRKSRLIVRNLPFEASKRDVRNLFGAYGQVKAVRLPKKFNNTSRGYAFVDFTTPQQAEKAMDLSRTHLLGRRLVLDYAEGEAEDADQEMDKMQKKVGRQSERVAMQKLTAGDRQKFVAGDDGEGMDEA